MLAIDEVSDICPIVDVWHKRKNLGQGYVDGGAQICVITQTCVEKMGLAVCRSIWFSHTIGKPSKGQMFGCSEELGG